MVVKDEYDLGIILGKRREMYEVRLPIADGDVLSSSGMRFVAKT